MTTDKHTEKELKHLVIVGGGFAGFLLSKRIDHRQYRVTLVDRKNFHACLVSRFCYHRYPTPLRKFLKERMLLTDLQLLTRLLLMPL